MSSEHNKQEHDLSRAPVKNQGFERLCSAAHSYRRSLSGSAVRLWTPAIRF